jgi:4-nitrophenyl phosphatase
MHSRAEKPNQATEAMTRIEGLILDMDGVLWRGDLVLPGADDLINTLNKTYIPHAFATNNATKTAEQIAIEGQMRGLSIKPEEVITSAMVAVSMTLSHLSEGAKVFVLGEGGLTEPMQKAGFELIPSAEGAQAVVVGLDREVTWDKLSEAAYAIEGGAIFIGTNGDLSLPTERGFAPGNGAILQALEATTGIPPTIVGKPDPIMFHEALRMIAVEREQALVVGDRLETDILGGIQAGLQTALVLTGASTLDELDRSTIQPDYVFPDLLSLQEEILGR